MIVAVAGSRGFYDYSVVKRELDKFHQTRGISVLVHGDCIRSPDILADKWARQNRVYRVPVPAEWQKHGKAAGPIRNADLIAICDVLIAFWNGTSSGTRDIINQAKQTMTEIFVIRVRAA